MSDVSGANPKEGVHYAPKCCVAGCGEWGIAGFASSKNVEPRWWCWEHYPHKIEEKPPAR